MEGLQQFQASAGEQQNGRIEDLAQQSRITRVAAHDGHGAMLSHFALLVEGVFEGAAARYALGHRAADSRRYQFAARGAEYRLRRAEPVEQFACHPGAQAGDQGQRHPMQFLFTSDSTRGGVRH